MNSDIRLSVGFWQHPKVRKLEKRLGLKGVRSLQILWCWCAQNRPSGVLAGMDAEDIELAADWRGKAGAFFEQCINGWLDEVDGVYVLHEWQDYNPWQVANGEKANALREKRQKAAMARWAKTDSAEDDAMQNNANAMQNDASALQVHMQNQDLHDANGMQNKNVHMQNDASASLPIPIPIPEEIKNIKSIKACAELSADTSAQPPEEHAGKLLDPCFLELPLSGKSPPQKIFASDISGWQELYPAVDVPQQLRNMLGWLQANPTRRKTKNGIKRFIANWLAKEQDRTSAARASPNTSQPATPTEYQKNKQDRRLMMAALGQHMQQEWTKNETTTGFIPGNPAIAGENGGDIPDWPVSAGA